MPFRFRPPQLLSRFRQCDDAVSRDADELMNLFGAAAYETATMNSWREDTGLVITARPGHWWRVRREIGRRLGVREVEPTAEFVA